MNVAATGHYKTAGQVCVINNNLVDFEGNRDYAFECRNGNCNIEVVIDNVGNTAHYIKAVPHTYELKASESYAATCQAEGKNVYYCKVCNDKKEDVLSKTLTTSTPSVWMARPLWSSAKQIPLSSAQMQSPSTWLA